MINLYIPLGIFLILLSNYLAFGYGVRIGKALQKEIPPAPLVEPVKEVVKSVARVGKRTVKLVKDISELKALKKPEKEETSIWDN